MCGDAVQARFNLPNRNAQRCDGGANMIDGTRSGTREEVGVRIRELVERLNERREGKARQKAKR